MHIQNLPYLSCPQTHGELGLSVKKKSGASVREGTLYTQGFRTRYPVTGGIADLTFPHELRSLDREFNRKYDANASFYNKGMDWLFASFYEKEKNVRDKLVSLLELKPSHRVLNVGCGTGSDSIYILRKLHNPKGKLINLDLSLGLLKIARKKLGPANRKNEFVRANASYLPFKDATFDSVFHFGGINVFSEKKRSIDEMCRVVRPGGRVVIGDESVAPWLARKEYGKILKAANPLYRHRPPLHLLPEHAQDVSLSYVLGNAFYVIAFRVGEKPSLNLDLTIPGKRGGTLRSRYEAHH